MQKRFNAYKKNASDFFDEIYIECPTCKRKCLLIENDNYKITCLNCGYNKEVKSFLNMPQIKFWYSIELSHGKLWAYNLEHLKYIKNHVSANLRKRSLENISNKSIGSRLPKWITSKKNRDDILKAIEKLEIK